MIKKWSEDIRMANRFMKRCSASPVIRKMSIKTTKRYHRTLARMAIINKSTDNICQEGSGEKRTFTHCLWECKLVQLLWKTVWSFLKKLKMEPPHDPGLLTSAQSLLYHGLNVGVSKWKAIWACAVHPKWGAPQVWGSRGSAACTEIIHSPMDSLLNSERPWKSALKKTTSNGPGSLWSSSL